MTGSNLLSLDYARWLLIIFHTCVLCCIRDDRRGGGGGKILIFAWLKALR